MKIEVNLNKKVALSIIAGVLVLALGVFAYAYGTNNPAVLGHSLGEIDGFPTCNAGEALTKTATGGWDCISVGSGGGGSSGLGKCTLIADVPETDTDGIGEIDVPAVCKNGNGCSLVLRSTKLAGDLYNKYEYSTYLPLYSQSSFNGGYSAGYEYTHDIWSTYEGYYTGGGPAIGGPVLKYDGTSGQNGGGANQQVILSSYQSVYTLYDDYGSDNSPNRWFFLGGGNVQQKLSAKLYACPAFEL